jgi:hypothetical protein
VRPCLEISDFASNAIVFLFFKAIVKMGYRTTPQVKAAPYRIDLVVDGANDRRLAVEPDGDKYHGPEIHLRSNAPALERVPGRSGVHVPERDLACCHAPTRERANVSTTDTA